MYFPTKPAAQIIAREQKTTLSRSVRGPSLLLVGGGLANCLIAARVSALRPDIAITILEAGASLGGNHTWSFYASDLTPDQNLWLAPYVVAGWSDYDVIFPGYRRTIRSPYLSITSRQLHDITRSQVNATCRFGSAVVALSPTSVTLANGDYLEADAVIDGRGHRASDHAPSAFQKFLGIEIRTNGPHGIKSPIMMDATVEQIDGYRFVYVLPLASDRLLVEDTYYSGNASHDADAMRSRLDRYLSAARIEIAEIIREERGVLPIGLGGDPVAFWSEAGGIPLSGARAGLFHPTTGYSLPEAVRMADLIANHDDLSGAALFTMIRAYALRKWRRDGFYRLLDRLMFQAAEPALRYMVLARFYGLPADLIARFYAGKSSLPDKMRVLVGKPPVPFLRALRCVRERKPAPAPVAAVS